MKTEDVSGGLPGNPGATTTSDIAVFADKIGGMSRRMPNPTIKSFAKKSGKSFDHVEKLWKDIVSSMKKKHDESDKNFYPMVVGALKKALNIKESNSLTDKIKKNLEIEESEAL